MKIVSGRINWSGINGDPQIELVVDRLPSLEEMRFEQRGPLYYAEKGANARFFAYTSPGFGYGGSKFNIAMKDGSHEVLEGPWSSRAGCMNEAGFGPCVDVTVSPQDTGWRIATAVTLEALVEACEDGRIDFGKGPEGFPIGDGFYPALFRVRPDFVPGGEFIHMPGCVDYRLSSVLPGRRGSSSEVLGMVWRRR